MSAIEISAAALGLANQWLTVQQLVLCWPVGILSVLLYAFVFFEAKLYSDLLLQGCYVVLQIYGWWNWTRLRGHGTVAAPRRLMHVRRLSATGWLGALTAIVTMAVVLGGVMARFTDASMPYWDAGATALSLTAQALQAMKILESWILFIAANLIFIALYAVKGLYPTIVLFAALTAMAFAGHRRWFQTYRRSIHR